MSSLLTGSGDFYALELLLCAEDRELVERVRTFMSARQRCS